MMTISNEQVGDIQLLLYSLLLAVAFTAEKQAMNNDMNVHTFNCARLLVTTVSSLLLAGSSPCFTRCCCFRQGPTTLVVNEGVNGSRWSLLLWTVLLSITVFGSVTLQQVALQSLSASKTVFVLRLEIILLPLLCRFIPVTVIKRPLYWFHLVAVCIAIGGIYLLCFQHPSLHTADPGLLHAIYATFCWTAHSIINKVAALNVNNNRKTTLSLASLSLTTALCAVFAYNHDPTSLSPPFLQVKDNLLVILVAGFCESIAAFFMVLGCTRVPSSHPLIFFAVSAIFTAILGHFLLTKEEILSTREIFGAVVMILAMMIVARQGLLKDLYSFVSRLRCSCVCCGSSNNKGNRDQKTNSVDTTAITIESHLSRDLEDDEEEEEERNEFLDEEHTDPGDVEIATYRSHDASSSQNKLTTLASSSYDIIAIQQRSTDYEDDFLQVEV